MRTTRRSEMDTIKQYLFVLALLIILAFTVSGWIGSKIQDRVSETAEKIQKRK